MKQIQFESKIWEQGNSLIITIPKDVKESFSLKKDDILRLEGHLITKEELEREQEFKRLLASYPIVASGSIIHKDEEVAKLHQVFFRIIPYRGGFMEPGQSLDDLPERKMVSGIISHGQFLVEASTSKHYGSAFHNDPYVASNLMGTEKFKLNTREGKEVIVKGLQFQDKIVGKSPLIKMVKFFGELDD